MKNKNIITISSFQFFFPFLIFETLLCSHHVQQHTHNDLLFLFYSMFGGYIFCLLLLPLILLGLSQQRSTTSSETTNQTGSSKLVIFLLFQLINL